MKPSPIPRADVVSPGHSLKRRCDNCLGYTTEIAGSSYFRKVLWHCPRCTAARAAQALAQVQDAADAAAKEQG